MNRAFWTYIFVRLRNALLQSEYFFGESYDNISEKELRAILQVSKKSRYPFKNCKKKVWHRFESYQKDFPF